MAPASASVLPAAGAKRPAVAAADGSDAAELPLPQDGVAAGKNQSQGQQQQQLECPRCKSRNTKFCYYNNYSTTQPRHFCRACRRYWTHGGTLRNVPVGGACRRRGNGSKRRRSAEPSPSPASPTQDAACRAPDALPVFPFLTDGVFLPQFDLGLGSGSAATAVFPWTPASAAPDLYGGLTAQWGGADGTLPAGVSGAWDDFTTGLDLTWPPPPPPAGN
ncbi:hypothetical protein ACQ4PT_035589 [Festuca glaucescens]